MLFNVRDGSVQALCAGFRGRTRASEKDTDRYKETDIEADTWSGIIRCRVRQRKRKRKGEGEGETGIYQSER